jgi:predicted Rossmann fold nucleotide-binding protein DprA/Smf involved in DNA uptake
MTLVERGVKEEKAFDVIARKNIHSLEKIQAVLAGYSVSVVTIRDVSYPALLREIANPPFLLYIRGELSVERALLSIV